MPHDFIGLLEEDKITYFWFQQDGVIAHAANNSVKLLNEIFGESVISKTLMASSLVGSYCTRLLSVRQQNLQCIVIAHARLIS
jgi:hypothetical protein